MLTPIETYRTELDAFETGKLARKVRKNCILTAEELAVLEQGEQALKSKKDELEKETADFNAAGSGLDTEDLIAIKEYIAGLEIEVKELENSFRTQVIELLAEKMSTRQINAGTLEKAREQGKAARQLDETGKFRDRANQTKPVFVYDGQGVSKAGDTRRRTKKAS